MIKSTGPGQTRIFIQGKKCLLAGGCSGGDGSGRDGTGHDAHSHAGSTARLSAGGGSLLGHLVGTGHPPAAGHLPLVQQSPTSCSAGPNTAVLEQTPGQVPSQTDCHQLFVFSLWSLPETRGVY